MRHRVILVFLFLDLALTAISVFLFWRLDQVVHGDLYRYGLQFNYEWAVPYWTYARFILGSIGLQIAITTSIIVLILRDVGISETQRPVGADARFKTNSRKLVSFIMLSVGSLALIYSINYASKILAFIGLGLILWSILLFYAVSDKVPGKPMREKKRSPSLDTEKATKECGYEDEAVHLQSNCKDA